MRSNVTLSHTRAVSPRFNFLSYWTLISLISELLSVSRSIVIEGVLKEKLDNPAPLAYFYCARDLPEPQRADPDEVLWAIVKQLS